MMNKISMVLALSALAACSGTDAKDEKAPAEVEKPTPVAAKPEVKKEVKAPTPAAVEIPADAVKIVIEGNDAMQFSQKEVKVAAGSTVALTLNHVGKIAKAAMGHNIVILAAGTDVNKFAAAAMAAKAEDYVPSAEKASVIAATKLIGGGESDTVVFKAPAPGTYDFICSFPGHYAVMKGKFIVE